MENLQKALRRHQHTLMVVGAGVMGFGIWSVVKSILTLVFLNLFKTDKLLENYIPVTELENESNIVLIIKILVIVVTLLIELILRWKVGKEARAIAADNKPVTARFYLLSAIPVLIDSLEFVSGILAVIGIVETEIDIDIFATLLVDFTSVVMLIEMIYSAVQINKIKKELAATE